MRGPNLDPPGRHDNDGRGTVIPAEAIDENEATQKAAARLAETLQLLDDAETPGEMELAAIDVIVAARALDRALES